MTPRPGSPRWRSTLLTLAAELVLFLWWIIGATLAAAATGEKRLPLVVEMGFVMIPGVASYIVTRSHRR